MFKVTSTLTRPTTSITWFSDTPDGLVIQSFYNDALVLSKTITTATDQLSKTTELTFNSYNDYQNWIAKATEADPLVWIKRNDYIVANSMTLKVEESIDGGAAVIEKMI